MLFRERAEPGDIEIFISATFPSGTVGSPTRSVTGFAFSPSSKLSRRAGFLAVVQHSSARESSFFTMADNSAFIFITPSTSFRFARKFHDDTLAPAVVPGHPHTRYIVLCQGDLWFVKFDGEEYGPYKTEREAMLFAIDAAHRLGENGEPAQVLSMDDSGNAQATWTYGQDPYPPGR